MRQCTQPAPSPSRRLRLWLNLIDAKGLDTSYKLLPRQPSPDQSAAVRLVKTDAWSGENVEVYDVTMSNLGTVTCTCPGFTSHKHCKHSDALIAAKVLLPGERLLAAGLGQQLAEASNDLAMAHARIADLQNALADLAAKNDAQASELASRPARRSRRPIKPATVESAVAHV